MVPTNAKVTAGTRQRPFMYYYASFVLVLIPSILYSQPVDIFIPTEFNLEYLDETVHGNVSSFHETELIKDNDELPDGVFSKLKNDTSGHLFENTRVQACYEKNSQRIATFNSANKLTCLEDLDDDGKLDEKKIFKYNDKNLLIETIEYDEENKLDEFRRYVYNGANKLVRESVYDEEGRLKDRNDIKYDSNGNLTQELDYDDDNTLERRTLYLNYDVNDNWQIKVTQSLDNDGTTRITTRDIYYR